MDRHIAEWIGGQTAEIRHLTECYHTLRVEVKECKEMATNTPSTKVLLSIAGLVMMAFIVFVGTITYEARAARKTLVEVQKEVAAIHMQINMIQHRVTSPR